MIGLSYLEGAGTDRGGFARIPRSDSLARSLQWCRDMNTATLRALRDIASNADASDRVRILRDGYTSEIVGEDRYEVVRRLDNGAEEHTCGLSLASARELASVWGAR